MWRFAHLLLGFVFLQWEHTISTSWLFPSLAASTPAHSFSTLASWDPTDSCGKSSPRRIFVSQLVSTIANSLSSFSKLMDAIVGFQSAGTELSSTASSTASSCLWCGFNKFPPKLISPRRSSSSPLTFHRFDLGPVMLLSCQFKLEVWSEDRNAFYIWKMSPNIKSTGYIGHLWVVWIPKAETVNVGLLEKSSDSKISRRLENLSFQRSSRSAGCLKSAIASKVRILRRFGFLSFKRGWWSDFVGGKSTDVFGL